MGGQASQTYIWGAHGPLVPRDAYVRHVGQVWKIHVHAPISSLVTSSTVGVGWWWRFTALLGCRRSTQRRLWSELRGFGKVTMGDTQQISLSTCSIMPCSSHFSSSCSSCRLWQSVASLDISNWRHLDSNATDKTWKPWWTTFAMQNPFIHLRYKGSFTLAILCLVTDILEYVLNWREHRGETGTNLIKVLFKVHSLHEKTTQKREKSEGQKQETGSYIVNTTRVTPIIIFQILPLDECCNSIS